MQERRTYDRFRLSGQAAVVRTGNREIPDADLSGRTAADSRLPSVRQLAIELSVNPNTIQRAYMTLEQEGLIYPVKGKGNFVADTQKIQEKYKEDFRSEFLELVKRGCRSGFEEKELLTLVQRGYKEEQK